MHIAIEGMDGVGKTTAAKKLAEKLNFKFVEKPLHYVFDPDGGFTNYIRIRDYINQQVDDDALRAWFYGLGNVYLYHKFAGENIITDRHLLSNYFWCGGEKTEPIYQCLIGLIGKPDYTFLLWASEDAGMKRLRKRDPGDPDLRKVALYKESKEKMEGFLIRYSMKYKSIDTTSLSAKGVLEVMMETLRPILKSDSQSRSP
ncbi:MAG: AAA family ATPase [Candidatus Bathyarchaeia archaeon]|jgi:thymidylate kinase